jgi:bifunctional non-homologous end joining protein LigD
MANESILLHNDRGGSDKVYHLELKEVHGGWVVNSRNGRRVPGPGYEIQGSAGGMRTPGPVPYETARRTYNELIQSKVRGRYVIIERISAIAAVAEAVTVSVPLAEESSENEERDSGKYPMLLIPIADEATALRLCDNPSYCGQEKEDGERRMLLKNPLSLRGINRNGEFVPIPQSIRDASDLITLNAFLLDGEIIGEKLRVWDLLEHNGEDMREQSMQVRYERLALLIPNYFNFAIQVVPTTFTRDAKLKMFHDIKARGGEGMVFKLVAAPYQEGKSKYALKFKFKEPATVQIVGVSSTKRSVQMGVIADGGIQFVGNVTIPVNKDIPSIGQFAEVEYLYAYPNGGSLFQPVYLGPRPDKVEADRYDSLKFKRPSDGDGDAGGNDDGADEGSLPGAA